MRMTHKLASVLLFASVLSGVSVGATAQENSSVGRSIFIPPLQEGLADARARMSDEEFVGCFMTAAFVDDFARRAKSQESGQSMADALDKFDCASSEKVGDGRYQVTGSLTVNGEAGPITSEIIQVRRVSGGRLTTDELRWAVGRFLLGGREIFRDENF